MSYWCKLRSRVNRRYSFHHYYYGWADLHYYCVRDVVSNTHVYQTDLYDGRRHAYYDALSWAISKVLTENLIQ